VLGLDLVYGTDNFINSMMWVKCNNKRSMEYSSEYVRQERKDTSIVIS
jgi:hypothetical protein